MWLRDGPRRQCRHQSRAVCRNAIQRFSPQVGRQDKTPELGKLGATSASHRGLPPQRAKRSLSSRNGTTAGLSSHVEAPWGVDDCGYGADGNSPCVNSAPLEDASNAYGLLTAKTLGADFSLVAWSGKGLLRNAPKVPEDTTPTMPEVWTRRSALDDANTYPFAADSTPNAVVINLGTNDFAYLLYNAQNNATKAREPLDINAYIQAYLNFIKQIRVKYPTAYIFLTTTSMFNNTCPTSEDAQHTTQFNALNKAAQQASDSRIQVVDFPAHKVGPGLNGCDSHPNLTEHKALAAILAPAIKTALAW